MFSDYFALQASPLADLCNFLLLFLNLKAAGIFIFTFRGKRLVHILHPQLDREMTRKTDAYNSMHFELATGQNFVYYIGILKLASRCCKHFDKVTNIPSSFAVGFKNLHVCIPFS